VKPPHYRTASQDYQVGDVEVTVSYTMLKRQELPRACVAHSANASRAILFLPGWSLTSSVTSVGRVARELARAGRVTVLSIDTRPDRTVNESLYKEAAAVRLFIQDQGIGSVTILGHSQGGIKAAKLAVLLQRGNPKIDIGGVILIDPVGLYGQSSALLCGGLLMDVVVNTPRTMIRELFRSNPQVFRSGIRVAVDLGLSMAKEVARTRLSYPYRLIHQVREMCRPHPHFGEIEAPVILVQGVEDPISDPHKLVSNYDIMERITRDEDTGAVFDPREKLLRETYFSKSPAVRMVVGTKLGHHGLPFLRDRVGESSLYLLGRLRRNLSL
jgi:pimeloyl-ACP methyl ester carboxylesterase